MYNDERMMYPNFDSEFKLVNTFKIRGNQLILDMSK